MDPATDWKTLAAALTDGGATGLGRVSEALGVRFTPADAAKLVAMHAATRDRFIAIGDLLAFLDAVLADSSGLRVNRTKNVGYGQTHVHWLGVRWDESARSLVTIGLRRHSGSARLDAAWPELAGWAKSVEKNRAIAVRWAQAAAPDRLTLEVTRSATAAPSDDNEATLRAAIVDAPDDPGPRSVYADWLLERNQPLGELINLSSAPGEHHARIKALEDRLWTQLGPITKYATRFDFVGGFITKVKMTVPAFERDGEVLFRQHPIRTLELDPDAVVSAHLERLANAPAIPRVRCLHLELGQFTDKRVELAGLARGVRLERLEELRLHRVGVSAADWRDLFERLDAPRLRTVRLMGTRTSSTTLAALARNPALAQLEDLTHAPSECVDRPRERRWGESFATVAERMLSLRRLSLVGAHTGLAVDELATLFGAASRVSLEELVVRGVVDTDALVDMLVASPRTSRLTSVELGKLSPRALEVLLGATRIPLRTIDLWMPSEATERRAIYDRLLAVPATHPLERVKLWANDVPDELRARFVVER